MEDGEYPSYMWVCNYIVAISPGVILSLEVLHTEKLTFLCANFWLNFLTKPTVHVTKAYISSV